jgi:hypothetical protein
MATVTAGLTLASSAGDLTTQVLSLTVSEAITAAHTTGFAKTKVTQTGANTSTEIIYTASDYSGPVYLYLLNTQTTATDYIYVYDDTSTGDPVIAQLGGGNFGLIPLKGDKTLRVYGSAADHVLEYMVFGTQA